MAFTTRSCNSIASAISTNTSGFLVQASSAWLPVKHAGSGCPEALQTWTNNCQQENRLVSSPLPTDYQIIDTAGVSGGSLTYIKQADIILVPFIPHYIDLQVIIP